MTAEIRADAVTDADISTVIPGRGGAGLQRGRDLARRWTGSSTTSRPCRGPVPRHDRRQREHRRHGDHRPAAGPHPVRTSRSCTWPRGPRPGAQAGVDRSDAAVSGLHGRRPVHRPQCPAAPGRAPDQRPLRPGDRHPPRTRLPGAPGPEAGADLALLQPAAARRCCAPGSPTRSAGFKAIRADVAREVLPLVEDDAWFFDTELLVLAERAGLRIHEVPVDWVDDPTAPSTSCVRRSTTCAASYASDAAWCPVGCRCATSPNAWPGLGRRRRRTARDAAGDVRDGGRRVDPGVRRPLRCCCAARSRRSPQPAGAAADGRRQHRGQPAADLRRPRPPRRAAPPVQGLVVFAVGLAVTSGSLWLLQATGSTSRVLEVAVLTVANPRGDRGPVRGDAQLGVRAGTAVSRPARAGHGPRLTRAGRPGCGPASGCRALAGAVEGQEGGTRSHPPRAGPGGPGGPRPASGLSPRPRRRNLTSSRPPAGIRTSSPGLGSRRMWCGAVVVMPRGAPGRRGRYRAPGR